MLARTTPGGAALRFVAAVVAAFSCFLGATPSAFATRPVAPAPQKVTRTITISPTKLYTPTGLVLRKGDTVTFRASGRIHFGTTPIDNLSPAGLPRGPTCDAVAARQQTRNAVFPEPHLYCWSLIGKIGSSPAFQIGEARSITASRGGELSVGVNDNYVPDNSGRWSVSITLTRAPVTKPVTVPGAAKKSKNWVFLGLFAAGAVGALILLALLWRRERAKPATPAKARRTAKERRPAAAADAVPVAAVAAVAAPPQIDTSASAEAIPPPEMDATAGNIREVEFFGNRSLRVDYNHFPAGTTVRWRVARDVPLAQGEFTTVGGGGTRHVATIPLESAIDANAHGVDVSFYWVIGGVAFNYAVRRYPRDLIGPPGASPGSDGLV